MTFDCWTKVRAPREEKAPPMSAVPEVCECHASSCASSKVKFLGVETISETFENELFLKVKLLGLQAQILQVDVASDVQVTLGLQRQQAAAADEERRQSVPTGTNQAAAGNSLGPQLHKDNREMPVHLNVFACTWLNFPEAEGRRVDSQTPDWHFEASAKHIPAGGPAILARAPVHQPLPDSPQDCWACLKLPTTCSALLAACY